MASINRVEFTTTSLLVWLSDGSYWMNLLVALPTTFLYHATPAQRANWQLADRDTAIEWPDLGERLSIEQMERRSMADETHAFRYKGCRVTIEQTGTAPKLFTTFHVYDEDDDDALLNRGQQIYLGSIYQAEVWLRAWVDDYRKRIH